mmetsp:Transcript_38500/g.44860  ORF Transcript_38500/g.44860 Transcript_38500/m.44860 type:complete len:571 (+) Transcript_38500:154-1866(+)
MVDVTSTQDDESLTDISELFRMFDSESIHKGGLSQISEEKSGSGTVGQLDDLSHASTDSGKSLGSWFERHSSSTLPHNSNPSQKGLEEIKSSEKLYDRRIHTSQLSHFSHLTDDESSVGGISQGTATVTRSSNELAKELSKVDREYLNKWHAATEKKFLDQNESTNIEAIDSEELFSETGKQPDLNQSTQSGKNLSKWSIVREDNASLAALESGKKSSKAVPEPDLNGGAQVEITASEQNESSPKRGLEKLKSGEALLDRKTSVFSNLTDDESLPGEIERTEEVKTFFKADLQEFFFGKCQLLTEKATLNIECYKSVAFLRRKLCVVVVLILLLLIILSCLAMGYKKSTVDDVLYRGFTAEQIDQRIKFWEKSLEDGTKGGVADESNIKSSNLVISPKEDNMLTVQMKRLKSEKEALQVELNEMKYSLNENKALLISELASSKQLRSQFESCQNIYDASIRHAKLNGSKSRGNKMYHDQSTLDTSKSQLLNSISAHQQMEEEILQIVESLIGNNVATKGTVSIHSLTENVRLSLIEERGLLKEEIAKVQDMKAQYHLLQHSFNNSLNITR